MNLGVFIYDFPHCRSNNSIIKILEHYPIKVALAAPYKKLSIPKSSYEISADRTGLYPKVVCDIMDVPRFVAPHNSQKCIDEIKRLKLDVGIIAGSRILSKDVIKAFSIGIINIHPGVLPENRGLDAMRWAVYDNLPQCVTAHWINEKVDAGYEICRKFVDVYENDKFIDVAHRLYTTQLALIKTLFSEIGECRKIRTMEFKPHTMMDKKTEAITLLKFDGYKKEFRKK